MNISSIPRVVRSRFGVLPDGSEVERITLQAHDGLEARIITYGATLQALLTPDAAGHLDDIVLGHDTLDGILPSGNSSARPSDAMPIASRARASRSTAPRCASPRITDPMHCMAGRTASTAATGGLSGSRTELIPAVTLAHTSADGDEGYPGTLEVEVHGALPGRWISRST